MQLSDIGQIAHTCWLAIPEHFPFVKLGNHIIMPNHIHGIIIIDKQNVGTQNFVLLPPTIPTNTPKNKLGPQSQNLASIVRGFKIGVTKTARQVQPDFAWQSRYHDHIICNKKSFHNISAYIANIRENGRKIGSLKFDPLIFYSLRNESTGLAKAARVVWKLTVTRATSNDKNPAKINTHQPMLIRKAKPASHSCNR